MGVALVCVWQEVGRKVGNVEAVVVIVWRWSGRCHVGVDARGCPEPMPEGGDEPVGVVCPPVRQVVADGDGQGVDLVTVASQGAAEAEVEVDA